jgi:hypothetical protein
VIGDDRAAGDDVEDEWQLLIELGNWDQILTS